MITAQQINEAITAHGLWRTRLQKAIESSACDFTEDQVCADSQCAFGRWLHTLPPSIQQQPIWQEVHETHARFHKESARILVLALQGQKQEALQALDHGESMKLTGKLIILMTRWSKQIQTAG
jgi:hypothetical protein